MPRPTLHFLLVPDRSAAWKVRRAVAEAAPMLGVRVVAWPELAQALRSLFLLPRPDTVFAERLAMAAAGISDAFWAESFGVAPQESLAVLERELAAGAAGAAGDPCSRRTPAGAG